MEPSTDTGIVRAVVFGLILLAFISVCGTIFLLWDGLASDSISPVVGFAGTSLGALGAILVSTRSVNPAGLQQLGVQMQQQVEARVGTAVQAAVAAVAPTGESGQVGGTAQTVEVPVAADDPVDGA